MSKYVCSICGYIYDEAAGIPDQQIAPGTRWEELPDGWACPLCKAPKEAFRLAEEEKAVHKDEPAEENRKDELRELSFGELGALCSNLAKGCEKQYLAEEAGLFNQLSEYFMGKASPVADAGMERLLALVKMDLEEGFGQAEAAASSASDRGALRALTWSQKVTRMLESLLARYEKEQGGFIAGTRVYVCEICGFIYVGEEPPEICPVCKVPKLKLTELKRR
ncbi:rubredoxin [Clostridium sp. MCC353]|uniref:rubredoxin n=1 Tax=Clostridium sp. MCC353 TaxID=2592646 RepID=UPI001C015BCB|nr:rubredoxin [Clostridium sp. MCC353]MBT9775350.1 rubredoxin [Clostridium sp. MCC353]